MRIDLAAICDHFCLFFCIFQLQIFFFRFQHRPVQFLNIIQHLIHFSRQFTDLIVLFYSKTLPGVLFKIGHKGRLSADRLDHTLINKTAQEDHQGENKPENKIIYFLHLRYAAKQALFRDNTDQCPTGFSKTFGINQMSLILTVFCLVRPHRVPVSGADYFFPAPVYNCNTAFFIQQGIIYRTLKIFRGK